MIAVYIILAVMSVPLAGIFASYYYKIEKMRLDKAPAVPVEERQLLKQLLAQNLELKERVQNLETIVTEHDKAIEDQKFLAGKV